MDRLPCRPRRPENRPADGGSGRIAASSTIFPTVPTSVTQGTAAHGRHCHARPADHDASPSSSQAEADDCGLAATTVDYEHSVSLPKLLERVGVSLVVSTYQAGKFLTVGVHESKLVMRFHHFDQAMGIARTSALRVPAATSDAGRRRLRSTRSSQSTSKAGSRIGRSLSIPFRRTSKGSCGHTSPVASSASDLAGHAVRRAGRVLS
jgi:hypothetical protein